MTPSAEDKASPVPYPYKPGEAAELILTAQHNREFFEAMQALNRTVRELCERAMVDSGSALQLASLATFCTEKLHEITTINPAVFERASANERVPVMVGAGLLAKGERWPAKVKKEAGRLGCNLDGRAVAKHRPTKQADTRVRALIDDLVKGLLDWRGPDSINAKGEAVDHSNIVKHILLNDQWSAGEGAETWRGWEGAARFLPPPSRAVAPLWWEVAEKRLRILWGGEWFKSVEFLNRIGKEFRGDEKAVSNDRRQMEQRFLEAVGRL